MKRNHQEQSIPIKNKEALCFQDLATRHFFTIPGQSLHQVGSVVEAERWFQSSLAAKPDHVPAHLTYARLLSDVGRVGEAERFYSDAIRIEPESSVVYRHYSKLL